MPGGSTLRTELVGELEGQFVVPAYQRGYRWGPQEVTQLLEDFKESEGDYYLQPVVVKKAGEAWELVDGQQRLTTTVLIYRYLKQQVLQAELKYQLSYETRPDSAAFLEAPTEEASQDNVDFHFMYQAWTCIQEWFGAQDNPPLAAIHCYTALAERVRIIWYEAPADVDARSLFTRLNVGRIPLTNAELVKALVLTETTRPNEVAAQWDAIERDLQTPAIWAFAAGSDPGDATRIGLLLDLLAEQMGGKPEHPFHTFETMRKAVAEEGGDAIWNKVVDLHGTLLGWYDDHTLFHKIGYLIATGSLLRDFVAPGAELPHSAFEAHLDERIRDRLNIGAFELDELDYQDDASQCRRVLELMNVETVRRQPYESHRYPFHAHATSNWSLEHIQAQSEAPLDEAVQWTKWLELHRDALIDLPGIDEEQRDGLIAQIDAALPEPNRAQFRALEQQILPHFGGQDGSDSIHGLSNLALLAGTDNSALNNSSFEVKRRHVIDLDKDGSFIPPATRFAFLKYYTDAKDQQVHLWGPQDREGYMTAIREAVTPYLKQEVPADG